MGNKKAGNKWIYFGYLEDWINHPSVRYLMYAVLGLSMFLMLMGQVIPKTYELKEGQYSPIEITSPVTVVDEYETERLKGEAAKAVTDVYTREDNIVSDQISQLEQAFTKILGIAEQEDLTPTQKAEKLKETEELSFLSDESISLLAKLPVEKIKNIKYISKTTLDVVMNNGVKVSELKETNSRVEELIKINPFDDNEKIKQLASDFTTNFVKPNYFFNPTQTNDKREEARASVQKVLIKKDELIVEQGQMIDKTKYEKLKAAGLLKDNSTLWPYFGLILIVVLLLMLLFYSIERMKPILHQNNKSLLMLFIILLLTLVSISILGVVSEESITSPIGFLAPVAFGVMLITLLISLKFAVLTGAIFSIYASLVFNTDQIMIFDYRYGFVLLIGSTAGAFIISRIRQRSSILKAGIVVALFNTLAILVILMLTSQSYTSMEALKAILFGVVGGIFSAVLTVGFLPFFESVFGILSPVNLIELSNPNHPLLRKLLIETPGTYHHSIIVGNLAESASEAIGANGLLARVGAYYHDLGKTKRPNFFVENQLNMQNPHDTIPPSLSKKIILAHPLDGVEMLKQHKIPQAIQDIAQQHHGTSLLKFFYNKALKEADEGEEIPESDYRYSGPKPQTKEAAIVSIADSVEAAVRSIPKPTNELIEETVRKIIKSKLDDAQLNECDVTMKELEIVAVSMFETMKGIFHSRIEYPDDKELEDNKGAKSS